MRSYASHRRRGPFTAGASTSVVLGGLLGLTTVVAPADADRPGDDLWIDDVHVIDVRAGTASGPRDVEVRDGEIVGIHPPHARAPESGVPEVDGRGRYLVPGLVDAHVHLQSAGDEWLPFMITHGVTSIRDMGGDLLVVDRVRARPHDDDWVAPRIVAAGPVLESRRWLTIVRCRLGAPLPWRVPVASAIEAREVIDFLVPLGMDLVKTREMASPEVFHAVADAAQAHGLTYAGHEPAVVSLAEAAGTGMRSFEHIPWMSLTRDEMPDEATQAATEDALLRSGATLVPTRVALQLRLLSPEERRSALSTLDDPKLERISPRLRQKWEEDLDMFDSESGGLDWTAMIERSEALLTRFADAGVPIAVGTDYPVTFVFPGSSVHDEMALLVEKAGLTPAEALRAATLEGARLLGLDDSLGTVEVGMVADLALLDANPIDDVTAVRRIVGVVVDGAWYDPAALSRLEATTIEATTRSAEWPAYRDPPPDRPDDARLAFARGDYAAAARLLDGSDDPLAARIRYRARMNFLLETLACAEQGQEVPPVPDPATVAGWLDERLSLPHTSPDETLDAARLGLQVPRTPEWASVRRRALGAAEELDLAALAGGREEAIREVRIAIRSELHGDETGALALHLESRPEGWRDDPEQLNSVAWWCFENQVALREADDLAARGVELATSDQQRANTLDTRAEIANALGDPARALALMREAVAMAPHPYLEGQVERFEARVRLLRLNDGGPGSR